MKKYLTMAVAVLAMAAMALPAYAFEVSWGGVFRARIISDNYFTGADSPNVPSAVGANENINPNYFDYVGAQTDHYNRVDQRARLYMYVTASENLRIVTRYEIGDIRWGDKGSGVNIGADQDIIEPKNSYIQFNIPHTPVQASVGVQGIVLLHSWLLDNDFSAAVLSAKLDPVNIQLGYIGGQNDNFYSQQTNVDDLYLNVDYNNGPFSATVVGFYQDGHNTAATIDPLNNNYFQSSPVGNATSSQTFLGAYTARDNNLFDLGLSLGYKLDWMNAQLSFLKNFGSVDLYNAAGKDTKDYKGWMIDASGNAFYGPYTFTLRGFYTSGPKIEKDPNSPNYGQLEAGADADWFVMPYDGTTVYTSELMGGGILDNQAPNHEDWQWSSYGGQPSNLWGISLGAAWQALPTTKLSAAYWYFGTSKDVVSGLQSNGNLSFDSSVGNEFDFYLTQDIVDGLKLDLIAAYMVSGDAYSQYNDDPNPYELGARIQWSF